MKSNWAEWSIKNKQVVYFFAILVLVMGIFSYNMLGRSEDPNFTVKQMVVSAAWPGATAQEMEQHVTDKLEKTIQTVKNVKYITSYSRPGVAVVTVYIKDEVPGSKIRDLWQEVRNLVADAKGDLPADVRGPFFNDHFDDVFGNVYAVTSDSFSYEDMRKIASSIKNQLVLIKDVKKVELVGVQPEKIYIQVSNNKLAQLGISIDTLATIIQAETAVVPAGMVENNEENTYLRLTGLPNTVANIESLPLSANNRTFRLGDVATIKRDYADPAEPKMYVNGKPSVGLAISMEDGGDNIQLGRNLEAKIDEIRHTLPLGFELNQVADQPKVVENAIGEFMESLFEAIAIVLCVSLLTLGRQSGYVISACIPLVLLGSFAGMYALDINLHKISLGALILSLGMLVDDAIVVVELIELKVEEGWDRLKAATFAFETCAKPLLIGTTITCISFMPIAFAKSNAGEFAGSLFPVITVTLMLSWVVSATLAPVLGYAWIKPKATKDSTETEKTSMFDSPFYKTFRTTVVWAIANPKKVIFATIAIFLLSLSLITIIPKEFFPASVRPELLVELNLPEGSSIKASDDAAQKLTALLKDNENVKSISTYVGKSAPRFVLVLDPVQPRSNYAQLVIVAKDLESRIRLESIVDKLAEDNLPDVTSYCRSIPLGPPSPYPVMFRVRAANAELAREYAGKLRDIMWENKNITLVRYDWMERSKAVKIEIDNDKLRQMGLTRKTVALALQAEISGYTISQYYENDQAIDLVFRLEPVDHANLEDLGTLSIPTATGAVQLNQVANLSFDTEEGMIWRRNLLPTITVNGDIGDGITGNDVTTEIYEAAADLRKNLPPSVTIEIGGSSEDSANTLKSLLTPVPLMLVIMLILLMIQLKDIKKLIIVFCTAPLGLIGVLLGLVLFNSSMGIMAQIGTLALVGTIIRNSVVLIDQIDQHLAMGMLPYDAVVESVIVRFRPIMLAALTTVLGLIPMFASAFWRSMAVGMASGLTIATIITLIVLPVLYCIAFKIKPKE